MNLDRLQWAQVRQVLQPQGGGLVEIFHLRRKQRAVGWDWSSLMVGTLMGSLKQL